jgi:hypothetical protein
MKAFNLQNALPALWVAAGLALFATAVVAEDLPAATAPPLAYGVPQILKLAQAKVNDDVIIAYIHNSGNSYGLDADQIIYLRQQGISDKILTTMLAQPGPASVPAPVAPPSANSYVTQAPVAYAQPTPAYVQTIPSSSVYVIPNNQIYYSSWYPAYYPYYSWYAGCYPYLTYSYGWCGGYHGGGYYRGGYCGGYYNGYCGGNYRYACGGGYRGGVYFYGGHGGYGYHGGVAYASRSASYHAGGGFGGGYHGGIHR